VLIGRIDMFDKYILDDQGNPVVENNILLWGAWMERNERKIAYDEINGLRVSTVFLALDHGYGDNVELYETMVFPPNSYNDLYCRRYEIKQEALNGHAQILAMVENGEIKED
jgi:hypothetical protein